MNHPSDPGGCTNLGITLATLRAWRGTRGVDCDDVRALTRADAAAIYAARYWLPVRGDELPLGVSLVVFDWGVNAGPRRAARALQKIVGTKADGWIGTNTLAATRRATRTDEEVECVVHALCDARQRFYERLRTFPTFGRGWTRRNKACRVTALRMVRVR